MNMSLASGLYVISNATRYNTDDIVALLDDTIKVFEAAGFEVKHAYSDTPMGTVIDISDYNPTFVWEKHRKYDPQANAYNVVKQRVYVKRGGYTMLHRFKIGLLPPQRLYDNPLEALVASGEEERVPPGLTQGLVKRFLELLALRAEHVAYHDWAQRDLVTDSIVTRNAAGIRIMKKRGTVDSKERALRKKRLAAQDSLQTNVYSVREAWHRLCSARDHAVSSAKLCRAAGVDLKFSTDQFEECAQYVDGVIKGMEQMQEMFQTEANKE